MTVLGVSDVANQTAATSRSSEKAMGKDDFLRLLVAQLRHQDPLNPAESTEFTAQLAQFSSLEQLHNINETLDHFRVYQSASNNIQSAGFLGKTVTASGSQFGVSDGKPDAIRFDLVNDADQVFIQIYDRYDTFVTDIQAGALGAGERQLAWDGRDANGSAVSDGFYRFAVMAMNSDGSIVGSTSYTTGRVTGIDYKSGAATLLINGAEVPVSAVIRIEADGVDTDSSNP